MLPNLHTNTYLPAYQLAALIDKNNVDNKSNDENLPTFHYYLEHNYVHPSSYLVFKTFSTKEITSTIKSLKTKNSHGYYEISIEQLKISATCICSPLTYICSKSILSGIFPDHLKFSIIKLMYMKGDRMKPTNSRPMSLLTSFLRVFEKVLYIRLIEHF